MSRRHRALALGVALLGATPAQAQRVTVGPVGVLADYKEVTAGLRYHGTGFGGALSATYHKLSAQATVTRLTFDPTSASTAGLSFKATQVDAWLGYDVAQYVAIEVGFIRRTADPEFEAQSLGAVRAGARSAYEIGPGAVISLRANYLAAPKFSGGGRAPFSLDLGLGLDVRFAGRLHGTAAYEFQRVGRKTDPGGTGEIDAPIQETVARVGLALGF
ncbi:MAG: hypothetical protein AUH42_02395 [Gemmatimonadetes bacterium 13_1_40CM_70_11]|nr:MAG: hypothetical protein AUH42_02395 [Gemmatimonadetes bacterium 13_1_40CM_70_11]